MQPHPSYEDAARCRMAYQGPRDPVGMIPHMPQAQFVALLALMLAVPPALYWLALRDERRRQAKRAAPPVG